MPKRPRQHIVKDLAKAALRDVFAGAGWTTEDLGEDYGEDFLIKIFDHGQATPFSFFVQSKGTDHIERYLSKNREFIAFPVKSEHANHWNQFWEPVILAVYDTKSRQTYWEIIQNFLSSGAHTQVENSSPTAKVKIKIPVGSKLDDIGLRRLRHRTVRRFERFEAQKEGAQLLIRVLKERWGVYMIYGPEEGVLMIPNGKFKPDRSGSYSIALFGRMATEMQNIKRECGKETVDILEGALHCVEELVEIFKTEGKLLVKDPNGSTEEFRTIKEYFRFREREQELE